MSDVCFVCRCRRALEQHAMGLALLMATVLDGSSVDCVGMMEERNEVIGSVNSSDLPPTQGAAANSQRQLDATQTAQISRLARRIKWTWVVAALGPALSIAGLVFTALQWRVAEQQLGVMESQLKDTREGATQTRKDTEEALATARTAQRAWVGVEGVASNLPRVGRPVDIVVTLKNSGRSPAIDIEQYYIMAVQVPSNEDELIKMGPNLSRDGHIVSHSTLFPADSIVLEMTTANITEEWMRHFKSKRYALYVHGKISYTDVFKQNHWTSYCFYTFGDTRFWSHCEKGNATDDKAATP